jgi:hypothetical protein
MNKYDVATHQTLGMKDAILNVMVPMDVDLGLNSFLNHETLHHKY